MEKYWIIAALAVGAFVTVEGLQCYQCDNCDASSLTDIVLVTCGADITTTTAPADQNSTSSSTTVSPVDNSTLAPGTNGTDTNGTDTNGTDTNGTDTNGTDTNGTDTNGTDTGANYTDTFEPQSIRVRRSVLTDIDIDRGCTCNGIECDCDEEDAVLRVSTYADITYVCVIVTSEEPNGTEVTSRGCAPDNFNNVTTCDFMVNVFNATSCKSCTTDKCNGAYQMQLSAVALLFVLASLLITKN